MHKAKILAIGCTNLRFQKIVDQDLQIRSHYGEFDRISWPGASQDFENVKKSALISLKLHDPDRTIIYEHEDCGAYGDNNSETAHKSNATKLKKALLKEKPQLQVETLIATLQEIKDL